MTQIASKPYPLKGIERNTCVLALLVFMVGLVLSLQLNSWQYLEKSGCIIVMIGIYIAWRDMTGTLDWAKQLPLKVLDELASKQNLNPSEVLSSPEVTEFLNDTENSIKILKKRVRNLEAILLTSGTFFWGFGSAIGKII